MKIYDKEKLRDVLSNSEGERSPHHKQGRPLTKCLACGKEVSTEAERCAHCGQPTESKKKADASVAGLTCGCVTAIIIALIIWYHVISNWVDSLGLFNK